MSTDASFAAYVRDQIRTARAVTLKKMFGEYAVYYDDKIVALICDNQLFVKPTAGGRALLGRLTEAPPYPGAKPYFLVAEELEDQGLVSRLIEATANALPAAKPERERAKSARLARSTPPRSASATERSRGTARPKTSSRLSTSASAPRKSAKQPKKRTS